jgi:predicted nucleotidyltransferase
MEPLVSERRTEIDELCRRHRVQRLELFGSAAGDQFDPERSDVDFLVVFQPLAEGEHADAYFGLREGLESLFKRPIDLVMSRAIRNRFFLQAIEPTRVVMYAA